MNTVTPDLLDGWATDPNGPVALHLKQQLLPLPTEADNGIGPIVFPPTYADIGYNVDELSDGRKVATIDSVGSQANRLEPLFKEGGPFAGLVPQITIEVNEDSAVSIFDLAHRAADATMLATPLVEKVGEAFRALRQGNAEPMCALAPTSLVFGVWDSRGETGEKRPRLIRSIIRAWGVDVLHSAAQFNSVWKKLDEIQQDELKKEEKKPKAGKRSDKGLADAPATFRKTRIPRYNKQDGLPNPAARVLGGVLLKDDGQIEREITVNLVALQGLLGADDDGTLAVRRYLLGLSLLAATYEIDLFLREGCLLRYADIDAEQWHAVPRRGDPVPISLFDACETIEEYARNASEHFRSRWLQDTERVTKFDLKAAKQLLFRTTAEETEGEAGS